LWSGGAASDEPPRDQVRPDWRADVLASNGKTRIAFEVQWSRQTLDRQQRYARDDIRCCWLFRFPPNELVAAYEPVSALAARKDLPVFALIGNENDGCLVQLTGVCHPVRTFVRALLEGQVKFSSNCRPHPNSRYGWSSFP
jgi:hypothetical protein